MGNMCGAPGDSRGAPLMSSKKAQIVTLWADYYSSQNRAMIAAFDYCKVPYEIEVIDSKCGVIREDSVFASVVMPSVNQTLGANGDIGGNGGARRGFNVGNINFQNKNLIITG